MRSFLKIIKTGSIYIILQTGLFSGEGSTTYILQKIHKTGESAIIELVSPDKKLIYDECSVLQIEIKKYSSWKWGLLARMTGSVRPKHPQTSDYLVAKLMPNSGKQIEVLSRTPLKRLAPCRSIADAAELDSSGLTLYFEFFRL